MLLIDANAILRYTLQDNVEMAEKVRKLMASSKIFIRHEVLAEVVYVLNKVYSLPRNEIAQGIKVFLSQSCAEVEAEEVLSFALDTFSEQNLDFVDCILYSFNIIHGHDVFTFDKKLGALIRKTGLSR